MIARSIPKKLVELGRLRIGDREPNRRGTGTHPHKLDVFRMTSSNPTLLQFAAGAYGGAVRPWVGEGAPVDEHQRPQQFELYTTVNSLDVLIPTASALTLQYEQWSAAGCQRRCTGATITHCPLQEALIGTDCTCPADDHLRAERAKTGGACARILRLNLVLPDLPGMGVWRLETKGFYATAELLGTLEMLALAGEEHHIIEAALRLEQRTTKKPGTGEGAGTLKYVVPVLWPKYTPRQLLTQAAARGAVLMAPAPALPASPSLTATIADLCGDGGGSDPTAYETARPFQPVKRRADPAGEAAAPYIAQVEAAILAQQGQVETWYVWAERRYKKPRVEFTLEDWEDCLQAVRHAAAQHRQEGPQEAHQGTIATQDERQEDPQAVEGPGGDTEASQPGTGGGPSWGPDLWQQEDHADETEPF